MLIIFTSNIVCVFVVVCPEHPDLILAIDSSSSIGYSQFTRLLQFTRSFTDHLNIGPTLTQLATETYANNAIIRFHLDRYETKQKVMAAMSFAFMNGATNTAAALYGMRVNMYTPQNGARPNSRKIGLVISDGHSANRIQTWTQAVKNHEQNITMLTVGVGVQSRWDRKELRGIATDPDDDNFVEAATFDDLLNLNITYQLVTAVCNSKLLNNIQLILGSRQVFSKGLPLLMLLLCKINCHFKRSVSQIQSYGQMRRKGNSTTNGGEGSIRNHSRMLNVVMKT